MTQVLTWTNGQLVLRERAIEARGSVEIGPSISWPRTTIDDAIAIAAVFDGSVQRFATAGLLRRWTNVLELLDEQATSDRRIVFVHNRELWRALESAAVFLDDIAAAPPSSAIWAALVRQLATPMRNAGPSERGPFVEVADAKTYDDLFRAQYAYLRTRRGDDVREPPPGGTGGTIPIPRTTNGDVIQLATYWSGELTKVKHVMGYDGAVKRWQSALDDIDRAAKPGPAEAVYAKNNEFWRDLQHVSTQIAVSDEAPSKWDMFVDSVENRATHIPYTVAHGAETVSNVVESAGRVLGRAAGDVGKGLLGELGAPVLIGAGVLAGLFLLTRSSRREEAR